jgi:hypothetical protein
VSGGLINYNKFLLVPDIFPHPIALTWMHLASSCLFSYTLYLCFGTRLFPGTELVQRRPHKFFGMILPIALCFGGSIILSNEAYTYCTVPFLQMCKEMNIVLVYGLTLFLGLEKFSTSTALILLVITFGCSMGVEGELNFSRVGFIIQIGSQLCEVSRIVVQQSIMQGQNLDPLTMVLCMSPLCLLALSTALYVFWVPEIVPLARVHWHHLLANSCLAFTLNVLIASLIKHCSGVAFVLAGVVKDITVVVLAVFAFTAAITRMQVIGFTIAVIGVGLHSTVRLVPEIREKLGIFGALQYLICNGHDTIETHDAEKGKK